jgi:hypothetical protein
MRTIASRSTGFAIVVLAMAGCAGVLDLDPPRATGPDPVGFPECEAESYDFVGQGTLAGLGLDDATPVRPPDPERTAMIWVTHDLLPFDPGEPGGPVERTRMLCFEFADGSGGSEWPVDPAWQPPEAPSGVAGSSPATALSTVAMVALAALLVIGLSVVAFRRRPGRLDGRR